jgi:pimeloyl-ACP methyl ester carboxylesterase
MATATANGITIEYDVLGNPDDPPMLLIMGLGAQLIDWPQQFCELLSGRGYRVIRFDNRDAGLSSGCDDAPVPDLVGVRAGDLRTVAYGLADLVADTAGLLDALEIDSAHVVGVSMGGMIAQQLAISLPQRVRSLCSIMSTTGNRSVGQPSPQAAMLLGRPPAATREEAIANALASSRLLSSPGFPVDGDELLRRATAKVDRAYRPAGTARQLAAILAAPDRTAGLRSVTVPAVVIHGADDPLIDVSGGRATADAIPGAELLVVPGMGHDLPRAVWPRIIDAIDRTARRAEPSLRPVDR